MLSDKLKEKIEKLTEQELELILGNKGTPIELSYNDNILRFSWPTQKVKTTLTQYYYSDWINQLINLKETLPEEIYDDLYLEFKKDIRNSNGGAVTIQKLIEWLTSGKERVMILYLLACAKEFHPEITEEKLMQFLENFDEEFIEDFVTLHIARLLISWVPTNSKKITIEFLKQCLMN